ncbi:MAG: hypothetical protein Q9159_002749 [Coniocarpon cinnabarinum]
MSNQEDSNDSADKPKAQSIDEKAQAVLDNDHQDDASPKPTIASALATWAAVSTLVMLVWLDEGIVATAIPSISNQFNALSDVGWYGSSYLFALCSFQLPFGKIYKDFALRTTFFTTLVVFEVGSIVQASSQSSAAFIVGRVIAGVGGAGVLTGILVIFSECMPKRYVPFAMGSIGWVYGIGVVAGPILGGVITKSSLTWRWCFWINPIAACPATIVALVLLKVPRRASQTKSTFVRLAELDYIGTMTFIPTVVCFLAALQIGAVRNLSPEESAVHTLAFVVPVIFSILVSGILVGKLETFIPFMAIGSALLAIGCGLLTTLTSHARFVRWFLFQAIAGFGAGAATQLPLIAVQGVLSPSDVPIGISIVLTFGYLGSSVAVSGGETILASRFRHFLRPTFAEDRISEFEKAGATNFRNLARPQEMDAVVSAFNDALVETFYVSVALATASLFCACMYGKKHVRIPSTVSV